MSLPIDAVALVSRHSLQYGDETIRFTIRREAERKVKRVAIHVEPDGRVIVDAPEGVDLAPVIEAVKKRLRWISQHLGAVRARLEHVLRREYVSGESLTYMGRRYRLKVTVQADAQVHARMRGAFIEVIAPNRDPAPICIALEQWFRQRARDVFSVRLAAVATPLRWVKQSPAMRLQSMKVQWGSCSPAGRITLNPFLIGAPRECIDYVLLHELCHLKYHNHSAKFYQLLDANMPGWRAVKERLDGMAEQLLRA